MDRMTAEPTGRLSLLDEQRAKGFLWLRFMPALEREFLDDHARDIVPRRVALLVAAVLLVAMTPLLEAAFLHPPAAFVPLSRWIQFGLMVPAMGIAAVFTVAPPLQRWSDAVGSVAAFAVCAGVIWQRAAGAPLGYHVPSELVAVVLTGTAIMAGLRLVWFAPAVVLILGLSSWSEITTFGAHSQSYYVLLAQSMLGMIALLGAGTEEYASRKSWLQRKMLEELTLRDPLTGLVNARGLRDVYHRVFATALREHRPLLVVAVDIDHFKAYNDHYGHIAGDDCLRRVANVLSRHGRRGNDIAARTGGEEFLLVSYDVTPDHAARVLETMRADVERLGILHAGVPHRPSVVTVSIGAVCTVPGPRLVADTLLQTADEQLYLSKQRGRNCVSLQVAVDDDDDHTVPPSQRVPLSS
jgi:diguanylate cyclase (GGDEF)-like protein